MNNIYDCNMPRLNVVRRRPS